MMKKIYLLIIMILFVSGISSFKNDTTDSKTSFISYYHDKFNGRKTASGEIFDNSKFTAAHRTLAFGTKIKVTNLTNGKSVTVSINDRGPFTASRSLDVSKAAFAQIASLNSGKCTVSYEVVSDKNLAATD